MKNNLLKKGTIIEIKDIPNYISEHGSYLDWDYPQVTYMVLNVDINANDLESLIPEDDESTSDMTVAQKFKEILIRRKIASYNSGFHTIAAITNYDHFEE